MSASRAHGHFADLVVVGAGILGLAVARESLLRHPGLRVLVLEKEEQIATHQTGHNSGVIHAGIYYAPGSLKARLCVEGSREIYAYCDEKNIPYERCGKLVVATDETELPRLDELHRRASANGVPGVKIVDAAELSELEPNAAGLRAVHSPATGIVDFGRVARAFAQDVADMGGEICTRAGVRRQRWVSNPSILGISTSRRTKSGVCARMWVRASTPLAAAMAIKPLISRNS